jgi:hypothetical protein
MPYNPHALGGSVEDKLGTLLQIGTKRGYNLCFETVPRILKTAGRSPSAVHRRLLYCCFADLLANTNRCRARTYDLLGW